MAALLTKCSVLPIHPKADPKKNVIHFQTNGKKTGKYLHTALDGHIHSKCSPDAAYSINSLAKKAIKRGLDAIVITDHDHQCARQIKRADERYEELMIIRGEEVTVSGKGHIGAWNLSKQIGNVRPKGTSFLDYKLKEIKKQPNTLAVFNHPNWRKYQKEKGHLFERLFKGKYRIDAIELWNGEEPERNNREITDWTHFLMLGHKVPIIGASDFHWYKKPSQQVGNPRTVILTKKRNVNELVDAVKRGRAYITNDSLLDFRVNNGYLGETISVEKGDIVRVRIGIRPTKLGLIMIYKGKVGNEKVLRAGPVPDDIHSTYDIADKVENHSYYRIEMFDMSGRHTLISNPIYVRTDK